MKTITYKTRILATAIAILLVAFTSTEANAQRRTVENAKPNNGRIEKKDNPKSRLANNSIKELKKTEKQSFDNNRGKGHGNDKGRDGRYENGNGNRGKGDIGRDEVRDERHGRDKHNDEYGRNDGPRGNGYHSSHNNRPKYVHVNPPRVHPNDYIWHHHKNVRYRHLPRKAVWIAIDGMNYAYYKGRFYLPGPFGFYKVTPPTYLHNLPGGCIRVHVDGTPMWGLHGILFIETLFGFKVIV